MTQQLLLFLNHATPFLSNKDPPDVSGYGGFANQRRTSLRDMR